MNLLLLVLLNKWIYSPRKVLIPNNLETVFLDDRVGFLKTENNTCFVVHRGTWSLEDVMYDLESLIYQKCNENGFLEVFYESYKHDYNIDMLVTDEACEEVYYTGHSLGGVTSRMAAAFATHGVPIKQLVTFGEPHSCCDNKINNTEYSLRVINGKDPIPTLPSGTTLHHCSSVSIDIVSGKWHDDMSFPNVEPKHAWYYLDECHRIGKYEKSIKRYINKQLLNILLEVK
jgi:hypothetical protein